MQLAKELLTYDLHPSVEAFSTKRTCGTFVPMDNGTLPFPVLCGHQVHSDRIGIVEQENLTRDDYDGYDALITALPNVGIGVRTADCVPVLLYDPVHQVAAAVHAGWRGTVLHIVSKTIQLMQTTFGCQPLDIHAQIGPSIGPSSFQVGEEVVHAFRQANFPMSHIWHYEEEADPLVPMSGGHHIDLWEANRWLLLQAGLMPECIHVAGIDTYTHSEWFSARREGISCGRIINAIRIRKE